MTGLGGRVVGSELPYGFTPNESTPLQINFLIPHTIYSRRPSSTAGIRFYHVRSVRERAGDLDAAEHIPRRSMDGAD